MKIINMNDKELLIVEECARLHEHAFELFEQGRDKDAFVCMLKSAELGDVLSQYHVGCYYEEGCGVKQNYIKAAEFYEKVSSCREMIVNGYPFMPLSPQCEAEFALGKLYERGLLPYSTYEKALEWYEKAISDGSSEAAFEMAKGYFNVSEYDRAADYLFAASKGYPSEPLKEKLFSFCLRLLEKESSHTVQLLQLLGEFYGKGWGTEIIPDKAKACFERAAEIKNNQMRKDYGFAITDGIGRNKYARKSIQTNHGSKEKG